MVTETLPEQWLRGPLADVPSLLQPVAHALLQALDEIEDLMTGFADEWLWQQPSGVASPGFHLLHIAGVIDRMATYAKGQPLSDQQFAKLKEESSPQPYTVNQLMNKVAAAVQAMIAQLKTTGESTLAEPRTVGRKALPSTVIGLLFHAAEHTMRHVGQLLVTVKMIKDDQVEKLIG